jgi:hypothetical protein
MSASLAVLDRAVRREAGQVLRDLGWMPGTDGDRIRLSIALEDWTTLEGIGRPAIAPILALLGSWDGKALRAVLRTLAGLDPDWVTLPDARSAVPVLTAALG